MMNKFKKIVVLVFMCLFSLSLFAQTEVDESLQESFVIMEGVTPHNLNPYSTAVTSDVQLLSGLYEGLFTYNPVTLDPQYAIANDVKVSRDKKRWIFSIRPEACFSNGEPITAQSVKDAWLMLLATPDAPYASMLDIVIGARDYRTGKGSADKVGIYVKDEHTLSVYLNQSANYLPKILCHTSFCVVHQNPTVYSGAYILNDITQGVISLTKNAYYWDAANTQLKSILFVQSDNPEEIAHYYNNGVVDWVCTYAKTEKILNQQALQYNAEFGTGYLFFKTKGNKNKAATVWDYPEFRNAVLEAFPWETFRKNSLPATTFVYPLSGYPQIDGFSFTDEIEADILMKDARKKYNIPETEKLTLNLEIGENSLTDESLADFSKALEPLGVELKINKLPVYEYLGQVPVSKADMFLYVWIGDFADPLAFLELFHGGSTLNDSGWQNDEFDALIDKAATVSDEERYKLLGQAETILLDNGMVLPIYHPVCSNIINLEEIGGWTTNAFDIHPLKYIYKKGSKCKLPNVVLK